jgi:drug/metabolite transporter (DMT)-like permease
LSSFHPGAAYLHSAIIFRPRRQPGGQFLQPHLIFGIALAWAFLGEQLFVSQWIGALVIVGSVLALQLTAASGPVRASPMGKS